MKVARSLSVICLAAAASIAGGTRVAGGPPQTSTETTRGLEETFVEVVPTCDNSGEPVTITTVSNVVEHITLFDDGREHSTFSQTGRFVAMSMDDPPAQVARGRFTLRGGFNANGNTVNGTFTFSVRGRTADGERISFHATEHFNVRPDGTVNEVFRCHD
ncbi:MAG: hypothetical protein H0U21_10220 [Acidimicrobiia bacterium]|nr:hypothetical protein [Acidimicrobiia bacterium]